MQNLLNDPPLDKLYHFYNKVECVLAEEKIKIIKGSIFITIVKLPVNRVSKVLKNSAISKHAFLEADLKELQSMDYICDTSSIEGERKYNITALGLWTIETQQKKIDTNKLISFYQETKFSTNISNKRLNDTEKIILTSMISMRNFDLGTAMNLKDRRINDYWIEVFDDVFVHLSSKGLIRSIQWEPQQAGVEHPISYLLRRAQDLPQKTKHIYEASGDYRYFLNVFRRDEDARTLLKMLFLSIYEKVESKGDIKEISSFLNDLAYNKATKVRDSLDFINPDWDSIIEEALLEFYLDQ